MKLFKEHLEVQEKQPNVVSSNQFALVNTLNIDLSLFNSIFGSELESDLLKGIVKGVKKLADKIKQL